MLYECIDSLAFKLKAWRSQTVRKNTWWRHVPDLGAAAIKELVLCGVHVCLFQQQKLTVFIILEPLNDTCAPKTASMDRVQGTDFLQR